MTNTWGWFFVQRTHNGEARRVAAGGGDGIGCCLRSPLDGFAPESASTASWGMHKVPDPSFLGLSCISWRCYVLMERLLAERMSKDNFLVWGFLVNMTCYLPEEAQSRFGGAIEIHGVPSPQAVWSYRTVGWWLWFPGPWFHDRNSGLPYQKVIVIIDFIAWNDSRYTQFLARIRTGNTNKSVYTVKHHIPK